MPALTINKTYLNGNILAQADLDNAFNSITTFLNTTLIDSTNIQAGSILGSNIANATITQSNLGSASVGQAQLTSSAVGQNQLAPQAVAMNNIASSAVGRLQEAPLNYKLSTPNSGNFNTGSTTWQNVTNCTVSITTVGRPVFVGLPSLINAKLSTPNSNGGTQTGRVQIINSTQSSTALATTLTCTANLNLQLDLPPSTIWSVDFPPAGTQTYVLQAQNDQGGSLMVLTNVQLFAYEL